MTSSQTNSVRLSKNIVPLLYDLELVALTDLTDFTFDGKVMITLEVLEKKLNSITCHSAEIKIDATEVKFEGNGSTVKAKSVTFDTKNETVTFQFEDELPEGKGVLAINKYTGVLNDKMRGFYRSKYMVGGKAKYMAVTQFEATDARRCLPCWDEPAAKSEFLVTLTVPKAETVVSNMPALKGYPKPLGKDDLNIWKFAKTPCMSSYLLAFVVGEFDYIEAETEAAEFKDGKATGPVAIRVYAPKGTNMNQAEFSLDVAAKSLKYYTEFFEIGYPLPKLDLIAIPDFSSGAMENWGCVTYRTVCLLVDPKNTALKNKQYVAIVVAHELAHQWFGNLVTMDWWTELWLNEGFASWVEYIAVDKLFPQWKVWQSFVIDAHNPALGLDGLLTSHPIEVPVKHPSEIDEIFDAISYYKGASVIRMLANHLGLETFRKGLVVYLKYFAYKNATTIDLWKKLEVGGKLQKGDVASLMTNWTGKLGYPVISVEETKKGFEIKQKHFVASGDKGMDTVWQVPVAYELYNGEDIVDSKKMLLKTDSALIETETKYTAALFNKGSQAYCIVKYGPKLFGKITTAIKSGAVKDPVDRLGIQNDLMAIIKAGTDPDVNLKSYFELIKAYKQETEYIVWESLLSKLGSVSTLTKAIGLHEEFSKYMIDLLVPIATKLGWEAKEGEPPTDKMLRAQIIPLIGAHGHEPTVKKALSLFDKFYSENQFSEDFKGKPALAADFRSGVFRIAVKKLGKVAYDQLIEIYGKTKLQEEKVRILRSLGAADDEKLLAQTLNMALDFKKVRKQDLMYPVYGMISSEKGLRMTWNFLKKNWDTILKEFKGTAMINRMASVTRRFAKDKDYEDVQDFFEKNEHPGAERGVKQALESIKTQAAWLKRDKKVLMAALSL